MNDLLRWCVPGLVFAGPLHLFLARCGAAPHRGISLVAALPLGCVLQQCVRWRFEARDHGFRSPRRAALAVIIERGKLGQRHDRGDLAYQVYETVFYQRPDWQAARDHAHRCHDIRFLNQSIALACGLGTLLSLFAVGVQPVTALLYLVTLPAAGIVVHAKSRQTFDALELFDRALVLSHWSLYAAALDAIASHSARTANLGSEHAAAPLPLSSPDPQSP